MDSNKINNFDDINLQGESNLNSSEVENDNIQPILTNIPNLSKLFPEYQEETSIDENNIFKKSYNRIDDLLEEYVGKAINNMDILHKKNVSQIRIARIVLSLITFLNISYICLYHRNFFVCLIIEIFTIVIHYNLIKKMNLLNFIKKEIKSRPEDNMEYIIASAKQGVISKNNLKSRFILPITLVICFLIFLRPHVIYEKKDDNYVIRYYTLAVFNDSELIIPDEHNGKKVVEIRGSTFINMNNLKKISLPKHIKEIRGNTFENTGIEEIIIPEGVTRIGGHAFYGCDRLTNVVIPSTVREIGSSAFRRCELLKNVKIPKDTIVNSRAFKESPTRIERYEIDG